MPGKVASVPAHVIVADGHRLARRAVIERRRSATDPQPRTRLLSGAR